MKEFKGTKWPWEQDENGLPQWIKGKEGIGDVCKVSGHNGNGEMTTKDEANAKLIAATPELLVALQKVYDLAKQCGLQEDLDFEEVDYIGNAINKALGL